MTDLPYFASKVQFGRGGVVRALPIGNLNAHAAHLSSILFGDTRVPNIE